jgi:hypothetical protein
MWVGRSGLVILEWELGAGSWPMLSGEISCFRRTQEREGREDGCGCGERARWRLCVELVMHCV